jgi:hypothetical protein
MVRVKDAYQEQQARKDLCLQVALSRLPVKTWWPVTLENIRAILRPAAG